MRIFSSMPVKRKWIAAIVTVLAIGMIVGYFNRTALAMWGFDVFLSDHVENKLEESYRPLDKEDGEEPVVITEQDPFSLLLLGTDQRDDEQARSDTMIFAAVRPNDGAMLMISIPRDTRAEIPGYRPQKIAHAYAYGQEELAVETVEAIFGIPVGHYATINFEGFRDVIDAMGGISLPVEEDLVNDDPGHDPFVVRANQPSYNGTDALNYVRFREDGGDEVRTGALLRYR